jgi:hypothetical protein
MRIVSLSENLRAVEITAHLLNDPPPVGYTYRLPVPGFGLTSLDGLDRETVGVFRDFLQKLVNEWIRCGKRVMPKDAAVRAGGRGPAEGYSTEWEWSLSLGQKSGYEDGTGVRGEELDPSDPAFNSWLWRVYWDFLHRVEPNVWFMSDGEVCLNYTTPVYSQLAAPVALPPFLSNDSPYLDCWMEAVLWFMLLLNSGYAQRLDRCAFCARYFVRRRERKSGQEYKRGGASCGNCRNESSKASTSDTRAIAKGRMLDVAAEAWAAWKRSHRTPDRYSAVANRVNGRCKPEIHITTRKHRIESLWVKRNEKEILSRAQRVAPAKGGQQNAKG